ncbi:hypothetical protein C4D60_Mb01t28550 [Musa balbisiana]|uniref:Uncharacterized protein n=1 Tax=Musa balbisiana TaxID=52838 RepID=A0A4V4H7P0_MUSBA|nr:hypothetical protein C4D60_Mb01t28550 [Musa balbisiana]
MERMFPLVLDLLNSILWKQQPVCVRIYRELFWMVILLYCNFVLPRKPDRSSSEKKRETIEDLRARGG